MPAVHALAPATAHAATAHMRLRHREPRLLLVAERVVVRVHRGAHRAHRFEHCGEALLGGCKPARRRHRPFRRARAAHRFACPRDRFLELFEPGLLLGRRLRRTLNARDHEHAYAAAGRTAEMRHAEWLHPRATLHHAGRHHAFTPTEAALLPAARPITFIIAAEAALAPPARTFLFIVISELPPFT